MTGIYCIKVDNCIAYIGKSKDVESRIRNHWTNIFRETENKYHLLKTSLFHQHSLSFWIIEECKEEELGEKESKWIAALHPCLNSMFNKGNGKELDANTYFNTIFSTSGWIEGM